MKIRLISDLHIDVNRDYDIELKDNDVFTLVAGDICGTVDDTIRWMHANVKRGAFCAGNHIVYNPEVRKLDSEKVPIEDLKDRLHGEFPLEGDVTFMDYDVGVMEKEICDGVVLVGDVMYTDYMLPIPRINPNGDPEKNMSYSEPRGFGGGYLNDFVFGFTRKEMFKKAKWDTGGLRYGLPAGIWPLRPKYYREHHEAAWKKLTEIVERNADKDVILMTHHCLSKKCISREYVDDILNASYVSDKDEWIKAHPNVRLVFSGHVHHRARFKVGNATYVLNPLGYCRDTLFQADPKAKCGRMWSPDVFVDTETWKVTERKYENKKWRSVYDRNLAMMAMMSFF